MPSFGRVIGSARIVDTFTRKYVLIRLFMYPVAAGLFYSEHSTRELIVDSKHQTSIATHTNTSSSSHNRLNVPACTLKNREQVSVVHSALVLVVVMLRRLVTVSELHWMVVMLPFWFSVLEEWLPPLPLESGPLTICKHTQCMRFCKRCEKGESVRNPFEYNIWASKIYQDEKTNKYRHTLCCCWRSKVHIMALRTHTSYQVFKLFDSMCFDHSMERAAHDVRVRTNNEVSESQYCDINVGHGIRIHTAYNLSMLCVRKHALRGFIWWISYTWYYNMMLRFQDEKPLTRTYKRSFYRHRHCRRHRLDRRPLLHFLAFQCSKLSRHTSRFAGIDWGMTLAGKWVYPDSGIVASWPSSGSPASPIVCELQCKRSVQYRTCCCQDKNNTAQFTILLKGI